MGAKKTIRKFELDMNGHPCEGCDEGTASWVYAQGTAAANREFWHVCDRCRFKLEHRKGQGVNLRRKPAQGAA